MIHIDFLIEDVSGNVMLENLLPKIIASDQASYTIRYYKGIGRIPAKMTSAKTIKNRQLLEQLPRLLNGFGKTYKGRGPTFHGHVIVICDLDNNPLSDFKAQMEEVLQNCYVQPAASFCFAIEEGEAWLLGDREAIKKAYPHANISILETYHQDAICGTWEKLADVVGFKRINKNYQEIGMAKRQWAEMITPYMNIERNQSPSFQYFVATIQNILSGQSL